MEKKLASLILRTSVVLCFVGAAAFLGAVFNGGFQMLLSPAFLCLGVAAYQAEAQLGRAARRQKPALRVVRGGQGPMKAA